MGTENLIEVAQLCAVYNLEPSFFLELQRYELVEFTTLDDRDFIPADRLPELEKIFRLHTELDINMEGIDAILQLLQRIKSLQARVQELEGRLAKQETAD